MNWGYKHPQPLHTTMANSMPTSVNGTIRVGNYSETEVCIYGGEK